MRSGKKLFLASIFMTVHVYRPCMAVAQDLSRDAGVELEGIVIDRTLTHTGHEFYRQFSSAWLTLLTRETRAINLTVGERPSARWGSLVWVEYSNRVVYRTFLRPRRIDLEPIAASAARAVQREIILFERNNTWMLNKDLLGNGY